MSKFKVERGRPRPPPMRAGTPALHNEPMNNSIVIWKEYWNLGMLRASLPNLHYS